ncbi:hypothetical protein EV210_12330 [Anaerospora hongkongensis]|uniref:Uncharacterized protein n=1 Tax=Anaerospora hongkongensis TaxID=244830 RepID=A0A4R1PPA9_9FIRM|nr:hypothetical protein [Anaerospora hongkongensis]TCL32210.1 hypothetical protein EV210_12330 [Anaerospora hongkongensis]
MVRISKEKMKELAAQERSRLKEEKKKKQIAINDIFTDNEKFQEKLNEMTAKIAHTAEQTAKQADPAAKGKTEPIAQDQAVNQYQAIRNILNPILNEMPFVDCPVCGGLVEKGRFIVTDSGNVLHHNCCVSLLVMPRQPAKLKESQASKAEKQAYWNRLSEALPKIKPVDFLTKEPIHDKYLIDFHGKTIGTVIYTPESLAKAIIKYFDDDPVSDSKVYFENLKKLIK